jgi:hypothetical protein
MKCCNQEMKDWSFFSTSFVSKRGQSPEERVPHFYCPRCNGHYFRDKWYTAEDWFFYINEVTYEEHQRREADARLAEATDLLQSDHAHELINHSNPENDDGR